MKGWLGRNSISFVMGFLICFIIFQFVLYGYGDVRAAEDKVNAFGFPVFFNNEEITLEDALIINGRTYVQLREFCNKINVKVDWQDPNFHMLPIPGGNLPGGVNLTNPTFIYTDVVTDYYNTKINIECVDITGIYNTYQDGQGLNYSFTDSGLRVVDGEYDQVIPLRYNPSAGRMYLEVSEFQDKLLPYMIEICSQPK